MTTREQKLDTYSEQLLTLGFLLPNSDDIDEAIEELVEESDVRPIDPKAILKITGELVDVLKHEKTKESTTANERKYIDRTLRLCSRIIRTFNFSGTEKILRGDALKRQWERRNAMSRGENEPLRFDTKGNPFSGTGLDGRLYIGGRAFNGVRGGILFQRGRKYNGWHNQLYHRDGVPYTGDRPTWQEIIEYEDGKEIGRRPRTDV